MPDQADPAVEPNAFWQWLEEARKPWWLFASGLAVLGGLAATLGYLKGETVGTFFKDHSDVLPVAANLMLVCVALLFVHRRGEVSGESGIALANAARALSRLRLLWIFIWLGWLLLYVALFLRAVIPNQMQVAWWNPGLNLLNNLEAVAFCLAFLVMADKPSKVAPGLAPAGLPWPIFALILAAAFGVELGLVFQGLDEARYFRLLSGLFSGVGLALLVARFESKLIALPSLIIVLLYVYSALQPAWSDAMGDALVGQVAFALALLGKLVFFVVGYWFFTTEAGWFYFYQVDSLTHETASARKRFKASLEGKSRPEAPKQPGDGSISVFVSAPMASLPAAELVAHNAEVMDVVRALRIHETVPASVYFAGESMNAAAKFDLPDKALSIDLGRIHQCSTFLLVYSQDVASSALIEVGAALALGKPVVLLARDGVRLPFLLRGAVEGAKPAGARLSYSNLQELAAKLEQDWPRIRSGLQAANPAVGLPPADQDVA